MNIYNNKYSKGLCISAHSSIQQSYKCPFCASANIIICTSSACDPKFECVSELTDDYELWPIDEVLQQQISEQIDRWNISHVYIIKFDIYDKYWKLHKIYLSIEKFH